MITTILLVIIYLAFISLGLPDSILGVTIPSLQSDWGISLSQGGFLSMLIVGGSIISSFLSHIIIKKIGTGKLVFLSCLTTGISLLGFSLAPSYFWLILFTLPLGLGGGAVDSSINNYVALHFKAHHMNWLHSFWGIGATLGPVIMSRSLINGTWQGGYRTISIIQLSLAMVLLFTLPIWKKFTLQQKNKNNEEREDEKKLNPSNIKQTSQKNEISDQPIFKIKGVPYALMTMLLYCSVEMGTGLWGSSFLVGFKNFPGETAAKFIALYFAGITLGRVLSGFISFKLSNKLMIRFGALFAIAGIILLLLPCPSLIIGAGLILIGFGLAPIFPSMIHETPIRFGKKSSQKIIGAQMGFAYIGSAAIPPLLGLFFQHITVGILPGTLLILMLLLLITTERLNRIGAVSTINKR